MHSVSRPAAACLPSVSPTIARSYTAVPNELIDQLLELELTSAEAFLYIVLLRKRWGESDPYPKLATLARELGVSVSTLQRQVAQLVRAGLVAVAPKLGEHGGIVANTYHLLLLPPATTGTRSRRGQEGGSRAGRRVVAPVR